MHSMKRSLDVEGRSPFAVHAQHRTHADQGQAVEDKIFPIEIHVPKQCDQAIDHLPGKAVEFIDKKGLV